VQEEFHSCAGRPAPAGRLFSRSARAAENEATDSAVADADGTVVESCGRAGQVASAGQPAMVLPKTIRPEMCSTAEAQVYGGDGLRCAD
jgi:hypothetical protein